MGLFSTSTEKYSYDYEGMYMSFFLIVEAKEQGGKGGIVYETIRND